MFCQKIHTNGIFIFIGLCKILAMFEENKKNAVAFYKMAYEGNPRDAVDRFVGDVYIQHNPDVENEKDGFIRYFERMSKEYPEKSMSLYASLEKEIWLHCIHTKLGLEMMSMLQWTFSGLMKTERLWSIGIPSRRFQRRVPTATRCTSCGNISVDAPGRRE